MRYSANRLDSEASSFRFFSSAFRTDSHFDPGDETDLSGDGVNRVFSASAYFSCRLRSALALRVSASFLAVLNIDVLAGSWRK